ncbi:unnamed protein product, partial [Mesorhabditis spiculigera]
MADEDPPVPADSSSDAREKQFSLVKHVPNYDPAIWTSFIDVAALEPSCFKTYEEVSKSKSKKRAADRHETPDDFDERAKRLCGDSASSRASSVSAKRRRAKSPSDSTPKGKGKFKSKAFVVDSSDDSDAPASTSEKPKGPESSKKTPDDAKAAKKLKKKLFKEERKRKEEAEEKRQAEEQAEKKRRKEEKKAEKKKKLSEEQPAPAPAPVDENQRPSTSSAVEEPAQEVELDEFGRPRTPPIVAEPEDESQLDIIDKHRRAIEREKALVEHVKRTAEVEKQADESKWTFYDATGMSDADLLSAFELKKAVPERNLEAEKAEALKQKEKEKERERERAERERERAEKEKDRRRKEKEREEEARARAKEAKRAQKEEAPIIKKRPRQPEDQPCFFCGKLLSESGSNDFEGKPTQYCSNACINNIVDRARLVLGEETANVMVMQNGSIASQGVTVGNLLPFLLQNPQVTPVLPALKKQQNENALPRIPKLSERSESDRARLSSKSGSKPLNRHERADMMQKRIRDDEDRQKQSRESDQIRASCQKAIADYLIRRIKKPADFNTTTPTLKELGVQIEHAVYARMNGQVKDLKYKQWMTAFFHQLTQASNKGLYARIATGILTPHMLASLSPEDFKKPLCAAELNSTSDVVKRNAERAKKAALAADRKKSNVLDSILDEERDTTLEHGTHMYDARCRICKTKTESEVQRLEKEREENAKFIAEEEERRRKKALRRQELGSRLGNSNGHQPAAFDDDDDYGGAAGDASPTGSWKGHDAPETKKANASPPWRIKSPPRRFNSDGRKKKDRSPLRPPGTSPESFSTRRRPSPREKSPVARHLSPLVTRAASPPRNESWKKAEPPPKEDNWRANRPPVKAGVESWRKEQPKKKDQIWQGMLELGPLSTEIGLSPWTTQLGATFALVTRLPPRLVAAEKMHKFVAYEILDNLSKRHGRDVCAVYCINEPAHNPRLAELYYSILKELFETNSVLRFSIPSVFARGVEYACYLLGLARTEPPPECVFPYGSLEPTRPTATSYLVIASPLNLEINRSFKPYVFNLPILSPPRPTTPQPSGSTVRQSFWTRRDGTTEINDSPPPPRSSISPMPGTMPVRRMPLLTTTPVTLDPPIRHAPPPVFIPPPVITKDDDSEDDEEEQEVTSAPIIPASFYEGIRNNRKLTADTIPVDTVEDVIAAFQHDWKSEELLAIVQRFVSFRERSREDTALVQSQCMDYIKRIKMKKASEQPGPSRPMPNNRPVHIVGPEVEVDLTQDEEIPAREAGSAETAMSPDSPPEEPIAEPVPIPTERDAEPPKTLPKYPSMDTLEVGYSTFTGDGLEKMLAEMPPVVEAEKDEEANGEPPAATIENNEPTRDVESDEKMVVEEEGEESACSPMMVSSPGQAPLPPPPPLPPAFVNSGAPPTVPAATTSSGPPSWPPPIPPPSSKLESLLVAPPPPPPPPRLPDPVPPPSSLGPETMFFRGPPPPPKAMAPYLDNGREQRFTPSPRMLSHFAADDFDFEGPPPAMRFGYPPDAGPPAHFVPHHDFPPPNNGWQGPSGEHPENGFYGTPPPGRGRGRGTPRGRGHPPGPPPGWRGRGRGRGMMEQSPFARDSPPPPNMGFMRDSPPPPRGGMRGRGRGRGLPPQGPPPGWHGPPPGCEFLVEANMGIDVVPDALEPKRHGLRLLPQGPVKFLERGSRMMRLPPSRRSASARPPERGRDDIMHRLVSTLKNKLWVTETAAPRAVPKPPALNWPMLKVGDDRDIEMATDNFYYMKSYQVPPADYRISCFNARRRLLFLDWVHSVWSFKQIDQHPYNTYFIACHLADRFLSVLTESGGRAFEALGLAALQIAVKFETQCPLEVDSSVDYDQMLIFERDLLRISAFEVGRHTIYDFVQLGLKATEGPEMSREQRYERADYATMLAVVTTLSLKLAGRQPSLVAAAVIRLIVETENREWTPLMQLQCQYTMDEMRATLEDLCELLRSTRDPNWGGRGVRRFWQEHHVYLSQFNDELLNKFSPLPAG